ncbi:GNAT family N-acetyltransferase [Limosilactobacillus sp.]|uniref:GNAT family N-acetyltransferase n=1 Tax=Limosilactobacillus sp. TaxID=2773925 RepID=UPI003EFF31C7
MEFVVEGNKLIARDQFHPLIGELSFPAVAANRVVVERVFVNPDFRGQGIANDLVKHFVEYATQQQLTVKLMCPFAKAEFRRHPEYQKLLLPKDRMN